MLEYDLVIVGGGPAGLCAAIEAAKCNQKSLIIDRSPALGGQLIKQTHMFFGSESEHAKTRGIDIAKLLINEARESSLIEVWQEATVVGLYEDRVLTVVTKEDKYLKIKAKAIIIATGASEKFLAFENNDLPGIYGAGAVQTLVNLYGVKPNNKIIMVGSGNIGLIVSYQLLQAGIEIVAVIEGSSNIGGFKVHASKLRRLGIPIYTNTTIKRAIGKDKVEQVETVMLNSNWEEVAGTEKIYDVDGVCIAVGLTPMTALLSMVEAKMKYVGELGGLVPVIDEFNQTSIPGIFVSGDASSVEEASSAIVEGHLAGLVASRYLNDNIVDFEKRLEKYRAELTNLRSGPFGAKIRVGYEKLGVLEDVK